MKNEIDTFNNTDPSLKTFRLDDIIFFSDFIYLFSISITLDEEFYDKYKSHSYVLMEFKKKKNYPRAYGYINF